MKPTLEQSDIRDHAPGMRPGDILKIIAFAGAGKTTTLKLLAEAMPSRGVYLAFNKAIADEAKRKLALTRCTAATMHSISFGCVREIIGSPATVNARFIREAGILDRFNIPKVEGWNDFRIASAVSRALSAFCNSADEDFKIQHGEDALIESVGDPEFIRNPEKAEKARDTLRRLSGPVTEMAQALWSHMMDRSEMSHDMYLKAIDLDADLRRDAFRGYSYLMVDEAQDLNPVQRSILVKTGLPLIAVGDPYQQIYSWRGAENALGLLEGETKYLTQSFRFGENIAEVARHILSLRPDGGPRQRLVGAGRGDISGHKGSKVAIVCRTNMGMIDEALRTMNRGVSLHVDNMAGLLQDVRSAQALFEGRIRDVSSTSLKSFDNWAELKIEAEESDQSLARIVNLVEGNMVPEIERLAAYQTSAASGAAQVMICTAHRSKGLEWPGVQLGADWKDVHDMQRRYKGAEKKSAKHKTMALEEYNALYVAATRPILRLTGEERILFPDPEPDEEIDFERT